MDEEKDNGVRAAKLVCQEVGRDEVVERLGEAKGRVADHERRVAYLSSPLLLLHRLSKGESRLLIPLSVLRCITVHSFSLDELACCLHPCFTFFFLPQERD